MIDTTIFKLTQLTTSTASVIMGGLIAINKDVSDGIVYLFFGAIFTIILRMIEQLIFEHNVYHGNYR
ncbi:hypothetical protein J4466_02900 [Candidatus Pacearchaeota archaeon]|nr:hypothetical protein [Candidatus Pacearchaeota archaeon]